MQEPLAGGVDEPIRRVTAAGRIAWRVGDEGPPLLDAGEDADYAFRLVEAAVVGRDHVFLALVLGRGHDRDAMLLGVLRHPGAVPRSAAHEHRWCDGRRADHVPKEVDNVLWPLEAVEVAVEDDAIPGRIAELDLVP